MFVTLDITGLDACFIGIPIDSGTSNRPGTRFGPRQIRTESAFMRHYNMATGKDVMQFYHINERKTNEISVKMKRTCTWLNLLVTVVTFLK